MKNKKEIRVIKGHVASIGYEDSNPFEFIKWAVMAAKEGYTELVENEFQIALVTPEDYELIQDVGESRVAVLVERYRGDLSKSSEFKEECNVEYLDVVVMPLTDLSYVDGDARCTGTSK